VSQFVAERVENALVRNPAALLNEVADYIEEHGKARGMYERPNGMVCVIGGVRKVVDARFRAGLPESLPGVINYNLRSRAEAACQRVLSASGVMGKATNVISWSDNHNKETVVKALREAARWSQEHEVRA
jgi:hypothetical protein